MTITTLWNISSAYARVIELPDTDPKARTKFNELCLVGATAVLPVTGFAPAKYKRLDERFCQLLKEYDVPGASFAVAHNGKIIAARGYGWADIHKQIPVQPNSLFRIASVSKSLTAIAAGKLIEEGKLHLDDKAFNILHYDWKTGMQRDPRLLDITVENLLNCTAGWDRERTGDPLFTPLVKDAAAEFTPTLRPTPDAVIRFWLEKPVNYSPGTHFSYSNLCYTVLGRIIETVTKRDYEEYVKTTILAPCGAKDSRLGKTVELAPNEVVHYPFAGQEIATSVFPNFKESVPLNYGGNFCLETMRSDTGWLSSAPDLVKVYSSLFNENGAKAPISEETREMLFEWPDVPEWKKPKIRTFFAKGFQVLPKQDNHERVIFREGCLPGSVSLVAHSDDGITWCFLLNSRPKHFRPLQIELTKAVWECVNQQSKPKKGT